MIIIIITIITIVKGNIRGRIEKKTEWLDKDEEQDGDDVSDDTVVTTW